MIIKSIVFIFFVIYFFIIIFASQKNMDNIKSLLELYDDQEKNVFKSILISFFPIYLIGYLFFPTFQVLDIWKSLFLIAGVDIMLNFMLLFLLTPIEKEDYKFRCQMVLYSILLIAIISAIGGFFIGFSVSILAAGTMPILLGLFLLSSFIRKAEKKEK